MRLAFWGWRVVCLTEGLYKDFKSRGLGLSASVGQIFLTKAFAAGPASSVAVVALSQVVFCYVFEL